jgi:hypothetical protein
MDSVTALLSALGPAGLTTGTLLGLAILAIVSGKLLPRATLDRELAAKDQHIAQLEATNREWEEAWRDSMGVAAEGRAKNRDLIDSFRVVETVVLALSSAGAVNRDE